MESYEEEENSQIANYMTKIRNKMKLQVAKSEIGYNFSFDRAAPKINDYGAYQHIYNWSKVELPPSYLRCTFSYIYIYILIGERNNNA